MNKSQQEEMEGLLDDEYEIATKIGQTYISKKKVLFRLLQASCIAGISAAAAYGITRGIKQDEAVSEFSSALVGGISFCGSLATVCYAKGIRQARNLGLFKQFYPKTDDDEEVVESKHMQPEV